MADSLTIGAAWTPALISLGSFVGAVIQGIRTRKDRVEVGQDRVAVGHTLSESRRLAVVDDLQVEVRELRSCTSNLQVDLDSMAENVYRIQREVRDEAAKNTESRRKLGEMIDDFQDSLNVLRRKYQSLMDAQKPGQHPPQAAH